MKKLEKSTRSFTPTSFLAKSELREQPDNRSLLRIESEDEEEDLEQGERGKED